MSKPDNSLNKMCLTRKQLALARDLIRLCKKHQVTLQSDRDRLSIAGMTINKVTPDVCHVLNPYEKLKGALVSLKEIM